MSDWKAKRFWESACIVEAEGGFTVHLDGRPVRTPAKAALIVPTRALAEAIAAEWDAQSGKIDPESMPLTRRANSAIDKVAPQHDEVAEMLSDYGDADLICYRADSPVELVVRQAAAWDPLLDWAADHLRARLVPVEGVIHRPQDAATLARLHDMVVGMDDFTMAAFHDLVQLSGSLIIGFAAMHDLMPAEQLWEKSRLDEEWQRERWGDDAEAIENAIKRRFSFLQAKRFLLLINS